MGLTIFFNNQKKKKVFIYKYKDFFFDTEIEKLTKINKEIADF